MKQNCFICKTPIETETEYESDQPFCAMCMSMEREKENSK